MAVVRLDLQEDLVDCGIGCPGEVRQCCHPVQVMPAPRHELVQAEHLARDRTTVKLR